jgi:hypothetical protein
MSEDNEAGRPTKYLPAYNKWVKKLCLLGATDAEIADFFDVARSTISLWKLEHPAFAKALRAGKIEADIKVTESLFRCATGYEVNEVTFEKSGEKDALVLTTEGELTSGDTYKKKVVTKHIPANGRDAAFWLKNRRSKEWRDKHEIESTSRVTTTVIDWSESESNQTIPEAEGSSENS